jgi:glycosyltransferase involved in cell wall biosynthesis
MPRPASRRTTRRLLFLTCHLPWPPHSGGRRREFELLRRIGSEFELELYAVCKSPDDWEHAGALDAHCADVRLFAPDSLLSSDDLAAIDRFGLHRSRDCSAAVRRRCELESPLVHVEGSYLMQHLPRRAQAVAALVEQNVESSLWKQRAVAANGERRHACLEWWRRTRRAESGWWARAGGCAAVSRFDADEMSHRSGRDVVVVPDGCDHLGTTDATAPPNGRPRRPEVLMVSNFAYQPNVDAARFLVDRVLPRVRREVPDVSCLLVGNAPPPEIRELEKSPAVTVTGRVDSVEPYRERATVIVSPHAVGGGVKVQVLEALAQGKPLVATGVALQGLPPAARAGLNAVDGAEAFAAAVARTLRDPVHRERLAERSRTAAALLPTWDEAAETLLGLYASVDERRRLAVA